MKIDKEKLVYYIKKLSEPKILVIGDLALDEMIYGDAERISREAPVLILQHTHTKLILGGASNAAHNAATLNNKKVSVIGVTGDDYQAGQLAEAFAEAGINCEYVIKDSTRKTTTKTRISGSITTSITQQIVRVDRQTNAPIFNITVRAAIKIKEAKIPSFNPCSSFPPYRIENTAPLPIHNPNRIDVRNVISVNAEPTAANALAPKKRPTMSVSATL